MKSPLLWIVFFLGCTLSLKGQVSVLDVDSTDWDILLEDVVVTAQYAPTDSKNAVHKVKVIKAIDIERQGQNTLAEVLANQLNLRVSNDLILGNGLAIQGIGGENIQILIDGVPMIGRVGGNIDLAQINLHNIARIEIIQGAMSAQYGSNASGGVINLITKKSQLNIVEIETRNQWENIGIRNNSLRLGVQLGGFYGTVSAFTAENRFAPVDSLRLIRTDTLVDGTPFTTKVNPWNPKEQEGIESMLAYRWGNDNQVTYNYRGFNETLTLYDRIRRPQFRPYSFDETYTTYRRDHSLQLGIWLNKQFYLKSVTGYNDYTREKATNRLDYEPDTMSLVPGGQDTSRFDTYLHRTILSFVGNKKWDAQIGMEYMDEFGSGGRIVDSTTLPINEARMTNYAAWIGAKYRPISTLTLSGNLRYGYNSKYSHPLIPSFHVNWQPNDLYNIKASYANGFRAPSLKELHFNFIDINHFIIGNPDLKAEYAHNASIDFQINPIRDENFHLSFDTRLFYNHIRDRIIIATFEPNKFNYQNLNVFKTHGFNFGGTFRFRDIFTAKSSMAVTQLYNQFSEESETPEFNGLFEMQNEISVQVPEINTSLVLVHRYIGRRVTYQSVAEGQIEEGFIGGYQLLNATLSQPLWKDRIFLAAGVKNLTNVTDVALNGSSGGVHSSGADSQIVTWGRTYFVRCNVTLGIKGRNQR